MKKLRKFLATPGVSLCAIALGILLLGTSTVGGARAAITYYSSPYTAGVRLQQIEVKLLENDKEATTKLLNDLVQDGIGPIQPGVRYDEQLSVENPAVSGNIPEYVRVTIRRYWSDNDGNKKHELDPGLIELGYEEKLLGTEGAEILGNGWVEDTDARTRERIVLYYTKQVQPGDTTPPFCQSLTLNADAGRIVSQTTNNGVVTTTYLYDGAKANLEVTVDAIQNSNAKDAALSAWGRVIKIDETTKDLSLG